MNKKGLKILYWTPRVMSILFCAFISIFTFDAFDTPGSIWIKMGAFLIHLIPVFAIIGIAAIAWRWEIAGGAILFLPAVLFIILFMAREGPAGLINPIPFLLMILGGLFIWNGVVHRKQPYRKGKK